MILFLFTALYLYAGLTVGVQYRMMRKDSPLDGAGLAANILFYAMVALFVWPVVLPWVAWGLYISLTKLPEDSEESA